jgi:F-type H+-transporting ATPase subunit gamma
MATLREIRRRISSVHGTQQITKAMKMVSSVKLRYAQQAITAIRPYAYELRDIIAHLMSLSDDLESIPLLGQREIKNILLVPIAGDRGLCGAFNSNILRETVRKIDQYSDYKVSLYPVGRKSVEFFTKRYSNIEGSMYSFFNNIELEHGLKLSRDLIDLYESDKYQKIEIVYNEFKSAIQQNIVVEQFLPFVQDEEDSGSKSQIDFIYEPGKEAILNHIIPKHLNIQIWRMLLESNAAEQGARMTAMDSATENANELISKLTLFYNRTRQAAITKELSEIVGGAEVLNEK